MYVYVCIYIYVCVCVLWSYYLGQVWPFQGLLSGPSRGYYLGQFVLAYFIVTLSYYFVFLGPVLRAFSKNSVFQKVCARTVFQLSPVLDFVLFRFSVLTLLKLYKRGVSVIVGVFVVQRQKQQKNDNCNSGFGSLCLKMAIPGPLSGFVFWFAETRFL